MAITYQAGRRIQGLQRTGSTITYETDFSSNAGWTTTNSSYLNVDTSGEKLDFLINTGSLNDEIYRDLGSGFGSTSFVVRAKLHITSILLNTTAGQAAGFDIGLSDTYTISSEQPSNINITYFHINAGSADVQNVIKTADGSSNSTGNSVSNAPFNISSDGSDFWIQLWRNGDVFSCQLYTDSSYSSPTGALFTVTKTSVSALQFFFLRVFSQGVSGGNLVEGYIDDLKIYDGITSVVAPAGDVKPTNVQVGSRFEETDTRKMYHYNAPQSATDTTLFSTISGWTGDTSTFTNSGDIITWDTSSRGEAVMKTITTLSASGLWVMRFKFTKLTGDAMDGTFFNIGSSGASTSSLARMQDGNGLYPYGLHLYGSNGSTIVGGGAHNTVFAWDNQGATLETGTWDAGEDRWIQIQHFSATSATWKLYDNANFTGTAIGTATVTSMAGQSLDYDNFAIGTKWGTGRKHESIEDMQIWNGISTAPSTSNSWDEEGT